MKAEDLAIFIAIDDIYPDLPTPRGRWWTQRRAGRRELARRILAAVEPNDEMIDRMVVAFDNYGKDVANHQLLIDVARRDGPRCFWHHHRPDLKCSDDLSVEHLIPRSKGGSDDHRNLVLSCTTHNSARRDMSVEDFIAKGLKQ